MRLHLFLILLISVSCSSNLSNNKVSEGLVDFPGGRNGQISWEEILTFKRFSWYRGVTLSYDALLYRVNPTSKFVNWFSKDERKLVNSCKDLIITINYSAYHAHLKHSNFKQFMREKEFEEVSIRRFAASIKTHPAFEAWNLQRYKIKAFCHKKELFGQLIINFPSFPEALIKF